ncbi:MAG: acetyl-coenzyme A synthetase N-terminal domain-containing protein, partial [Dermatophilaceae bacterium]
MTDASLSSHVHDMDFTPDPAFAAQANGSADLYEAAAADHEGFWAQQARDRITWADGFDTVLDWSEAPFA